MVTSKPRVVVVVPEAQGWTHLLLKEAPGDPA
jgi:hypothetical protein